MARKKITIMFSRMFPTTHSRRGEPTRFIEKVMLGEKIHLIRRQYDRWKHVADKCAETPYDIALCQWRATPRRSNHVQIGLMSTRIGVQRISMQYFPETDSIIATVDGQDLDTKIIAENEGLSLVDFKEWFFGKNRTEHDEFNGCIIHFTDFRY